MHAFIRAIRMCISTSATNRDQRCLPPRKPKLCVCTSPIPFGVAHDVRVGWLAQTQLSLSIVGLDPIAGTICGPPIIAHSAIPGFSAIYSTLQTPPGFDGQIMLNEQYLFFTATAYDNTNAYPHWGIVRCASDSRLARCARVWRTRAQRSLRTSRRASIRSLADQAPTVALAVSWHSALRQSTHQRARATAEAWWRSLVEYRTNSSLSVRDTMDGELARIK